MCFIRRNFEKGEGFFINTNVLCSMENQEHCQIDSHLLNSTFLAGHFKSIFETKYLEPVLQNKKARYSGITGDE